MEVVLSSVTNVTFARFEESLDIRLNMRRRSVFSKNSITVHHVIPVQINVEEGSMGSRDGSDRSIDQVTTMIHVFFKRHPEPIWIPAIISLHNRVLVYSVLAISVLKETVVLAVNEVVVHSCVEARVGDPTVGEEIERTARFPRR
jgi:hypothetical protein